MAGFRSASLSPDTKRNLKLNYEFTLNPAIGYSFCYRLCPFPMLDDTKLSNVLMTFCLSFEFIFCLVHRTCARAATVGTLSAYANLHTVGLRALGSTLALAWDVG